MNGSIEPEIKNNIQLINPITINEPLINPFFSLKLFCGLLVAFCSDFLSQVFLKIVFADNPSSSEKGKKNEERTIFRKPTTDVTSSGTENPKSKS